MWHMQRNKNQITHKRKPFTIEYCLTIPKWKACKRIWWFQISSSCYMWNYQLCVGHTNKNKNSSSYSRYINLQNYMYFWSTEIPDSRQDFAFTAEVIQFILRTINYQLKIVSPFSHGHFTMERQLQIIGKMITKHLTGKEEM